MSRQVAWGDLGDLGSVSPAYCRPAGQAGGTGGRAAVAACTQRAEPARLGISTPAAAGGESFPGCAHRSAAAWRPRCPCLLQQWASGWVWLNCQFGAAAACDAGCHRRRQPGGASGRQRPGSPSFRAPRVPTALHSLMQQGGGGARTCRLGASLESRELCESCTGGAAPAEIVCEQEGRPRRKADQQVLGPSWASQAQHGGTLALCVGLPASVARGSDGRESLPPING